LLDLSAAFDTVDHCSLSKVLERRFAVEGVALAWFQSYFFRRTQTFYVGDVSSRQVPLMYGVPQGSILGPTAFIAYTEEFQNDITLVYHLYADDIQLLACSTVSDVDTCRHRIESSVMQIIDECSSRRLQLNPDKTELIWFGSVANLCRLQNANPTFTLVKCKSNQ
jgi:hypothetical protein